MVLVALRHVGSSWTRARTHVPCIGRQILNHCATREVLPLCLLIGDSPFTFNVITYRYVLITILLISFWLFCNSSVPFSSLALCCLMIFCSGRVLSLYILFIYYRFLICSYHEVYVKQLVTVHFKLITYFPMLLMSQIHLFILCIQ